MKLAFVGLPGSGKSTVFAAITGDEQCLQHFSADEPYRVMVLVPDERMEYLRELVQPKKFTLAHLELLDYHGLFAGGSSRDSALLAHVRDCDGIVKVLRGFTDKVGNEPDPLRDFDELATELLLGDLGQVERRVEKLHAAVKKPMPTVESDKAELAVLERCAEQLNQGHPISTVKMSQQEHRLLRGFQFLTSKPTMVVVNAGDGEPASDEVLAKLRERCPLVEVVNGRTEMEIAELPEGERKDFLADLGVDKPAAERLRGAFLRLLNLRCFFTTVGHELRAWAIPAGASALDAAGKIHTDIARGFIRAEVIHFDDLKQHGSMHDVKAANKVHTEGKEYEVLDGDILNIRFNV